MTSPSLPLHMRRERFDPPGRITALREAGELGKVTTPLGVTAWLVSGYDDAREVLGDAQRFSSESMLPFAGAPEGASPEERRVGSLLLTDPPEHTRLRRLLTGEFTVRRIRRLEPRITEIVDEHLDALAAGERPADLVAGFALPVPSLVICELLGVPYADRADFQGRAARQLDISRPLEERMAAAAESRAYMGELVDAARTDPGDDMLGMLVREHGDDLTRAELAGIAALLLIAGHETTANVLGLGTLALLRDPEQAARVRDDPAAVAPAVEELLRFLSVVHTGVPRRVTRDTVLAGQELAAGDLVAVSLPAANRDPALLAAGDADPDPAGPGRPDPDRPDPDRLDVGRVASSHLAFGHGVHHCLGAPLARMEIGVALPALLRRFPDLALAVPFDDVEFRSASVVYGLRALPATW